MIHAAQIAAEPPINANNRQRFIRSPRQRDAATELWLSLGLEANGLDWHATAVGQNSTNALRFHQPAAFAVLVNNRWAGSVMLALSRSVPDEFRELAEKNL